MYFKRFIPYFTLLFVVLTSTLLVWMPYILKTSNFLTVYKNFDGPNYIIAAKSMYVPKDIEVINRDSSLSQNPLYFTAHLPLYPVLIRLASPLFGYLKSMLVINIFFTCLLAFFLYYLLKKLNLTKHPLLISSLFLFLPRFLVVRSVGAPESLFLFLILASLFFFEKEKYLLAGLLGGLSVMTKTPGLILFAAYGFVLLERFMKTRKLKVSWGWIFLIPAGFLLVCLFYANQTGDFLAYFHSGDNIHLIAPFSVFDFGKPWIGTAWLEDVLFYFFLYGLTVYQLKDSKYRSFFYFSLLFWTATLFVQHRDISRYSLPLWPMACIAFESFFSSKKFKVIFIVMIIGIYMHAWNFLAYNVMPINEWLPFL